MPREQPYTARLGRDWRVRYEIDDTTHVVIVLDISAPLGRLPAPLTAGGTGTLWPAFDRST